MEAILIIEDDFTFAVILQTWLQKRGFDVENVSSISEGYKILDSKKIDLILSDLRLPDYDGIDLLKWIKRKEKTTPVIVMTGYADVSSAVQAMKLGAKDYVSKPVHPDELLKKIKEALSISAVVPEKEPLQTENKEPEEANYIEGESEVMRQLYKYVKLVAPTQMTVLINGASGTGKEFIARSIHLKSKRSKQAFIAIDCGSVPKELAASEFFGHVKGAFTGALNDKKGAFVEANGGTLFLDEVGNLPYEVQVQLLRALQEKCIRPVGSATEVKVDVRIVSATNENLESAVQKGTFREDLYHRLSEFPIYMPLLKDRAEDICLFADFFLDQANKELGRDLIGFDEEAYTAIRKYSWPGNLRQMKNIIKRVVLLTTGRLITLEDIFPELVEPLPSEDELSELTVEEKEKAAIIRALHLNGNNKSKAAIQLGIDRKTLYNKIKLYNL